jgi:hypothetical protein
VIQIEIITANERAVEAAFYYPVPQNQQSPAAVDPSRTPLGNGLSAAELQLLRDGELFEYAKTFPISRDQDSSVLRAELEKHWPVLAMEARVKYRALYANKQYIGRTWDGTTWS